MASKFSRASRALLDDSSPVMESEGSHDLLKDIDSTSADTMKATSLAANMSVDDYLVLIATTIMVFACIVGVYMFKSSRKIEYGEDERLLSDNKVRSPRSVGVGRNREDASTVLDDTGKRKKKKHNAAAIAKTKELKKKMKKESAGKMLTGVPEDVTYQDEDGVTLKDIEGAGRKGMGAPFDKSYDSNSDTHSSSLASSFHDDVLKRTLVSVLSGGLTITQHRGSADPKSIILSLTGNSLQWRSKKIIARNIYSMNLKDVDTIEWGKHAQSFSRLTASGVPDDLCCSLISRDQTLDLQCSTKTERDTLLHGISLIVGELRGAIV